MRCKFPDCITILRETNKDKFCSLHARILYQQDIFYEKGRFYSEVKSYKTIKQKGKRILKWKRADEVIPLKDICKLKELINIIDVFSEDRLVKDTPHILPKQARIDFSRA